MEATHGPVEVTLDLIGGKYKALILWRLSDGQMRFSQLRNAISGITAKMLTQQLREMESQGLIHREVFPVVPPHVEYSLTELGHSLMPVLTTMRDWGINYLHNLKKNQIALHTPKNYLLIAIESKESLT